MSINKQHYKDAFHQVGNNKKFVEFLERRLGEELLKLINSDISVTQKRQGKVVVLQEILNLINKGDTND